MRTCDTGCREVHKNENADVGIKSDSQEVLMLSIMMGCRVGRHVLTRVIGMGSRRQLSLALMTSSVTRGASNGEKEKKQHGSRNTLGGGTSCGWMKMGRRWRVALALGRYPNIQEFGIKVQGIGGVGSFKRAK